MRKDGSYLAVFSTFTGFVILVCMGVMSMAVAGADSAYERQIEITREAKSLVQSRQQSEQAYLDSLRNSDLAAHYYSQAGVGSYALGAKHEMQSALNILSKGYHDLSSLYFERRLESAIASVI